MQTAKAVGMPTEGFGSLLKAQLAGQCRSLLGTLLEAEAKHLER
ncbi:hypothetical protein [uncultured Thiodictyon sp.]|nr:hypothetical protein [uncultured Thiodictyon sp.]